MNTLNPLAAVTILLFTVQETPSQAMRQGIAGWIKDERLVSVPKRSGLRVSRKELTHDHIRDIAAVPDLVNVHFDECTFPTSGLSELRVCDSLYSVVIDGGDRRHDVTTLASLAEVESLERLTLSGRFGPMPSASKLSAEKLSALTELGSRLKELRMDDYGEMPAEALMAILKNADLSQFTHDSFYHPGVPVEAFGLLMTMSNLKSVDIPTWSQDAPEDWPRHERARIAINIAFASELKKRIEARSIKPAPVDD